MATAPPTPDPNAPQGAPAPGGAPSGAPAPPELIMLSKISMALQQLAQSRPEAAGGIQKAIQGINEAQSALVTGPQSQPMQATPPQ